MGPIAPKRVGRAAEVQVVKRWRCVMQRAYFDPSIVNRAVDNNISTARLRAAFGRVGLEPATGLHTVLELARTFASPDSNADRARQLFTLLRDLEPAYQPDVPTLLAGELDGSRTLDKVGVPSCGPSNVPSCVQSVPYR